MSTSALAWRHYRLERKMFWRNPTAAFFSFVLPLIFLVLFGAISSQENLKIIVPGIAGLSVMAPERRADILSLGMKSIVSGTLTTCLMGAMVGVLS